MGSSSYYRTLSPGDGRHHHGPSASTGMVQLSSPFDPYMSGGRHDYEDHYYPSDDGHGHSTSHRRHPSHPSRVEAQPIPFQKYRDPGQPAKKRTEYTIQPQPKSRHRSHTASAADLYDTPVRLTVPSSGHSRPVITSGRDRSPSPLPSKSDRYLVPASTRRGKGHHRVYSTDYASDTPRLDPRGSTKHRSSRHDGHRAHPSHRHRRYPVHENPKKGDEYGDYDVSYTTPREQFDRDYPVKPRHPRGRSSVDRPVSMNMVDEDPKWSTREDHRRHGPPPTSWGIDKIGRESRPRASSRDVDDYREAPRSRDYDRALVAQPYESDDGYDSLNDSRQRRHHRRPRHRSDRDHRDDRSPRPHNVSDEQVLPALGTVALGNGYTDTSDYDHRSARRRQRHSRNPEHDYDLAHRPSRESHDSTPANGEKNQQLLVPGDHHHRRSRRHSYRHPESDSDIYTDDEDLHKYQREPSAAPRGSRHSSTDTSGAEDHQPRHRPRDRSRHRSSRSQRLLEDGYPHESRHPRSVDSKDDTRKLVTVDPPAPKEPEPAPKGILKPPRESFPEEPNPVREGVAPLKDAHKKGIPPGARWTKIGRRLVNPAALEAGNERYEERADYVIVLRVLTKEEIEAYALKTQEIRDARHKKQVQDKRQRMDESRRHGQESSDDEDEGDEEPLKLEGPPTTEPDKQYSLPVRPHESNMPSREADKDRLSPSHAPAW